jgi:hypothetical protein
MEFGKLLTKTVPFYCIVNKLASRPQLTAIIFLTKY